MKIAKKNTNKDFKNLAVQTTCKHIVEQLYISAKNIWVFFLEAQRGNVTK